MKVGVFCMTWEHMGMAIGLVQSVNKSMPGVEVWHLTNESCPTIAEMSGVKRIGGEMPMAIRRMSLQASCEGEWLFLDTDIIVRKDVSDVFQSDFDVALTNRIGTITNEAAYASEMPYNIGVTFSRNPFFWVAVKTLLYTAPAQLQEWEGDQRVVAEMMKAKHRFGFTVKLLLGAIYNYPPKSANDPTDAAILHYKGNRKQWLKES